jgi:hypothetical protein
MNKFLVIGLVGIICGLGAVSCGNDAPWDGKLTAPEDTDWGTVATNAYYTTVPAAMLFTLTNADGTLPIPDAEIRFDAGDSLVGSSALICASPWNGITCSNPPPRGGWPLGGASSIKMNTDDSGAARIYPLVHTTDCFNPVTTTGSLNGDTSISASISASFTLTQIKYTVQC